MWKSSDLKRYYPPTVTNTMYHNYFIFICRYVRWSLSNNRSESTHNSHHKHCGTIFAFRASVTKKNEKGLLLFHYLLRCEYMNTPHGFPRSMSLQHSVAGTAMAKAAFASNITKMFTIIITRS